MDINYYKPASEQPRRPRKVKLSLALRFASVVVGIAGSSFLFADDASFFNSQSRSLYEYTNSLYRCLTCDDITYMYGDQPYGTWTELYEVGKDYFNVETIVERTPLDNEVAFVVPFLHCPER